MITKGTHHITGLAQTEVCCDHPGCDNSMYTDFGPSEAASRITELGWDTTRTNANLDEHAALCPTHAQTVPQPCTHLGKDIARIGGQVRCGRCGRERDAPPKPPGLMPAAALAMLARQIPNTGGAA